MLMQLGIYNHALFYFILSWQCLCIFFLISLSFSIRKHVHIWKVFHERLAYFVRILISYSELVWELQRTVVCELSTLQFKSYWSPCSSLKNSVMMKYFEVSAKCEGWLFWQIPGPDLNSESASQENGSAHHVCLFAVITTGA